MRIKRSYTLFGTDLGTSNYPRQHNRTGSHGTDESGEVDSLREGIEPFCYQNLEKAILSLIHSRRLPMTCSHPFFRGRAENDLGPTTSVVLFCRLIRPFTPCQEGCCSEKLLRRGTAKEEIIGAQRVGRPSD